MSEIQQNIALNFLPLNEQEYAAVSIPTPI
jgi:hypothetical protein